MKSTFLSKSLLENELLEIESVSQNSTDPDLYSILYHKFFYLIDKIPFAVYRKKPGNVVFRCRQNFNGEVFKNYKQISYPPKEYITKYGRANFPHESIFYGCIPSQLSNDDDEMIAAYNACILETDKDLLSDVRGDFKTTYTVGKWAANDSESNFAYLPFSHSAFLRNPMIRNIANLFHQCALQLYPQKEVDEIIIPFQKYISFKFSARKTSKNDYILTNAFKNALLNYYNLNGGRLDGIIYSSPMTHCAAINVVLTAEFVDKFLRLDNIVMMSCDGVGKQRAFDGLTEIIDVTDGDFEVIFNKK